MPPLLGAIPGAEARELAALLGKEPALVELILAESREVLRAERGVLIVETQHGFVCANAGIDSSNLPEEGTVCLCRRTPTPRRGGSGPRSRGAGGEPLVAVIVSDSFGRAWRMGQAEVAIGCAGIAPLDDWRGRADAIGRELEATLIAIADEAAAAADLVRDKTSRDPRRGHPRPRALRHRGRRPGAARSAAARRGPLPLERQGDGGRRSRLQ